MIVAYYSPSALANTTIPAYYIKKDDTTEVWLPNNYTGKQAALKFYKADMCCFW